MLSQPGPPVLGLPALCGGFVFFQFGKGWGWGREGQDPEGKQAARRAWVGVPRPRKAVFTVGAVNCPVTARCEPTGPALPHAHLSFGAARLDGVSRVGAGRSRQGPQLGPVAWGWPGLVRSWDGPRRAKGPTPRWGCLGKFDFNYPRVGGGSEVGQLWGSNRAWGTLARRRLLRGRKEFGPSWEARGAAGPRGSLLRSSNEWAPRRLRSGAALKGKTSLESRLRSHDGGRGGEHDEWRKRVGDGLGLNLGALPL